MAILKRLRTRRAEEGTDLVASSSHPGPAVQILSVESPPDDTKPEDGGWVAWTQVAAAFALYFHHLGLLNSFGVFQTYYASHLFKDSSPSAI
ncbi:hypothetical protein ISF_03111 [Cordyceps fumosorosea ARSEF 2679]|uniref:Major facilitator superfamily domain, general substrate transporter n=1 Tax=Cordyceps fumosorosea (strain ARSEF 2679) TaxID=1081104 RepID=A0A168BAA5_CORFA|nr:hypothetical protein ISF_03111 [Cordyceps fumosorosea ARSEF 2679]OAA69841.1 hypothetical protein ISF_03111 [Cordyceps fumosorosea ARSEF 2679]